MRKLSPAIPTALLILAFGLGACGQIEPDEPVDADGDPLDMPDPGEEWLYVTDITPDDELSVRPTIAIEFNQYLDATTFNSFGTVRLASRGHLRSGRVEYRMTRKTLLFRPTSPLEPGIDYQLRWLADDLRSIVGSPLFPGSMFPSYRPDPDLDVADPDERPRVGWDEVEEIFDQSCNFCHADPDWMLPELTRDGLVGRRSEQVERLLVEPYHPERSYLMHKILPDYTDRRHTVQPPPWSEAELSIDDVERIEHWIAAGAPG